MGICYSLSSLENNLNKLPLPILASFPLLFFPLVFILSLSAPNMYKGQMFFNCKNE